MASNLYKIFQAHCENIEKLRLTPKNCEISAIEKNKIESRATFLTLLDATLHDHRIKYGTPFNVLPGKKALVHLVMMKHHWLPSQINEMTFVDLLLSIQDELRYEKANEDTKNFLNFCGWASQVHHFDDFMEDEWDASLAGRFLKWRPTITT